MVWPVLWPDPFVYRGSVTSGFGLKGTYFGRNIKGFYFENDLVNFKEGFNMYKIPASVFESINDYGNDKEKSVLHVLTPMRISVNNEFFPRIPKKNHKAVRTALGLTKPATIEFTDDEMMVHDKQGNVARTEKMSDFNFVQFGAIRTMPIAPPAYTYSMTMVIGVQERFYYVLNPNFMVFQRLSPLLKQQGVTVEDPFDIASLPSNEERENYFNKFYVERIKGTNYPLQLKWMPFLI